MIKQNLLIDSRIRNVEYEYLSKYFNVIKLPLSIDTYKEISGHSDIFYCKINDNIICASNAPIIDNKFILGMSRVGKKYPKDIAYNVAQIGNIIIGSKYTDKIIKPNIYVKQGYVKCSICVTSNNSCITSDKNIYDELIKENIDVTYIKENNIKLLDRSGNITNMQGFIGGASFVYCNKFILFGDIEKLENKEKIIKHLEKYKLELIDFKNLDVYDYGGAIYY